MKYEPTGIAYLFSIFNMVFAGFWHLRGLHAPVDFEASSLIIAFILLGKLLEEKAKGNTTSAIKKRMGLQPKSVVVIQPDGTERQVSFINVQAGRCYLGKTRKKNRGGWYGYYRSLLCR